LAKIEEGKQYEFNFVHQKKYKLKQNLNIKIAGIKTGFFIIFLHCHIISKQF
jgi:hypothetical protein